MKVSAAKKQAFCDLLVHGQTPEGAANAIGVGRSTVYNWKAEDKAFAVRWNEARERKIEAVENVLYQMAMEKDLGAICFFLKAHRPELYNRRTLVLEGNADAPMQTETRVMIYPRREGRPT
jgi:transposase